MATMPRSSSSIEGWPPRFGFSRGLPGLGADVFAKGRRPGAWQLWPGSPKAATASAPTCVCSRTSARSKSRSRPSKSAPRRWLTSATRCGPSGCARWRRFTLALAPAASQTAATQWLERTLDDSAIRRLVIPQAFLAVDAILNLYLNIAPGLVVHPAVIERHVAEQLPFMATENLLMAAVQAGGDRQDLHERIRVHAMAASEQLKEGAARNDLLDRIRNDAAFPRLDFERILDPSRYTGRSAAQVDEFIANVIEPIRQRYPDQDDADLDDSAVRV